LAVSVSTGSDHDHRPVRVPGDLLENPHARAEALRHPRVLADEHGHLAALELAASVRAAQPVLDPRFDRLLLGQRARAERDPIARRKAPL
jgi:hypothetical protein